MLASTSRILLRTATGVGGRMAAKALAARAVNSSFAAAPRVRRTDFQRLNGANEIRYYCLVVVE